MPANIGEMFYYGQVPWHGEGLALAKPATVVEALRAGGLNWEVGEVDVQTCDEPPSPVNRRKALIRLDRTPGQPERVLGVAHRGFQPLQNRDGALLFDAIFGKGKPVYHTGGYLGNGEVVWLLAKIDKPLSILKEDLVEPYALFTNSHDGSIAFTISLTTIRVVCQNTLQIALNQKNFGEKFRRAHHGSLQDHAQAAQEFWGSVMEQLDDVTAEFTNLTKNKCTDEQFKNIMESLLPLPSKPRDIATNRRLQRVYGQKVSEVLTARKKISDLRKEGKGMDMQGVSGTLWGALSAITEFFDHHKEIDTSRISYALLGNGRDIKVKAYRMIQEMVKKAA